MISVGSPASKLPSDPAASIVTGTDFVMLPCDLLAMDPGVIWKQCTLKSVAKSVDGCTIFDNNRALYNSKYSSNLSIIPNLSAFRS